MKSPCFTTPLYTVARLVIAFAVLVFGVAPSAQSETTISKGDFSATLPDDWIEISPEILSLGYREFKNRGGVGIDSFDLGFQPSANASSLRMPFIIVERKPGLRLTKAQVADMLRSFQSASSRPSAIGGATVRDLDYDTATGILYITSSGTIPGIGMASTLSALVPSGIGSLHFILFSKDEAFSLSQPVLKKIVSSVADGLREKDALQDLEQSGSGSAQLILSLAGFVALYFGFLYLKAISRRQKRQDDKIKKAPGNSPSQQSTASRRESH